MSEYGSSALSGPRASTTIRSKELRRIVDKALAYADPVERMEIQTVELDALLAVVEAAKRSGYGGPHGHTWDHSGLGCSRCAFAAALQRFERGVA